MENGEKCMELNGHSDIVTSALFSPKDLILLTASKDTCAIIWNFENGNKLFTLVGHNLAINCAAFNNDGTHA